VSQEDNQADSQAKQPYKALLSDEEFATLVEREFHEQGGLHDELTRRKLWNTVEQQLFDYTTENATDNATENATNQEPEIQHPELEHKVSRKISETITNVVSLMAAAVLLLAIVPMFANNAVFNSERIKGMGDFPLVNISAFVVKKDGELRPAKAAENVGATLVFKVDLPKDSNIALAMSKAGDRPKVRYRAGKLSPGVGQLLEKDGRIYGYLLEHGDHRLKVCAIASENEKILSRRLRLLSRVWDRLPSASCVSVNTE
jgi:hypothetical protein